MYTSLVHKLQNFYIITENVPANSCHLPVYMYHISVFHCSVAVGQWSLGLLSSEVTSEEGMKLALCSLLQHLCDCQVN